MANLLAKAAGATTCLGLVLSSPALIAVGMGALVLSILACTGIILVAWVLGGPIRLSCLHDSNFSVRYHRDRDGRLLRNHGGRRQRPRLVAEERDKQAIARWG